MSLRVFDRMREVDLGSGRALLIKQHGEFSAMGHKCPHYGAPLVKGWPHFEKATLKKCILKKRTTELWYFAWMCACSECDMQHQMDG